jgi:hypothetical protein
MPVPNSLTCIDNVETDKGTVPKATHPTCSNLRVHIPTGA